MSGMKPFREVIGKLAVTLVSRECDKAMINAAMALLEVGKPDTYALMAKCYNDALNAPSAVADAKLTPKLIAKGRALVGALQAAEEFLNASKVYAEAYAAAVEEDEIERKSGGRG